MSKKDSIARMRAALEARMQDLDEFREQESEEVKFEREMDRLHLDWRKDERGKDDEEETVYLYLSSATRDRALFPSPGQYPVYLDSEVDNVVEAQLVQASFPATDPTVNSRNRQLRYSFAPFNNPVLVEIPVGNYKGAALAVEISTQLNMTLFGAGIPALYTIDDAGLVVDVATGGRPPEQFRVSYIETQRKFVFQLIDALENPSSTPFALHMQPLPVDPGNPWSLFNSDLYTLLGFDRSIVQASGTFEPVSQTYYILNTTASPYFGPAASPDMRIAYSVSGNQFADLRGHLLICIDIDKLNDNDIALMNNGPTNQFTVNNCFGFVLATDPATSSSGMLEINTTGYPVKKSYRNGRSRIKQLLVTLRRPDGTIYDFGGLDHFIGIKLTVKRTQPFKPVFGR